MCVGVFPPTTNIWIHKPIFMKLGMAPAPIAMVHFINPFHKSVFVFASLPLLGKGAVKTFPRQWLNTKMEELLDESFSTRS
jgi:hypothetical protein